MKKVFGITTGILSIVLIGSATVFNAVSSIGNFSTLNSKVSEGEVTTVAPDYLEEGYFLSTGQTGVPSGKLLYNDWYDWQSPEVSVNEETGDIDLTLSYKTLQPYKMNDAGEIVEADDWNRGYFWIYDSDGNPALNHDSEDSFHSPEFPVYAESTNKILHGMVIDYTEETREGVTTDYYYQEDFDFQFGVFDPENPDKLTSKTISGLHQGSLYTINDIYFGYQSQDDNIHYAKATNPSSDGTGIYVPEDEVDKPIIADDRDIYPYSPKVLEETFEWNTEAQVAGQAQFTVDIIPGSAGHDIDGNQITMCYDDVVYGNPDALTLTADIVDSETGTVITEGVELDYTESPYEDGIDSNEQAATHTFVLKGLEKGAYYDNLQFTFNIENELIGTSFEFDENPETAFIPNFLITSETVHPEGNNYLFRTSDFSKPLVDSSFMFTEITPYTATFSFSYWYVPPEGSTRVTTTDDYYHFNPEEDVYLVQNIGTDEEPEYKQLDIEFNEIIYKGTETDSDTDIHYVKVPSYTVSGLTPNTDYNQFSIFIEADESDPESEYYTDSSTFMTFDDAFKGLNDGTLTSSDVMTMYSVPEYRGSFKTPHNIAYYIEAIAILLAIVIFFILIAVAIYMYFWWQKHISMAVYFDGEESFLNGELIINLIHANRHYEIDHAHEEDLILYAAGKEIDAIFRRDPEVKHGFKIYVTEDTNDRTALVSIMSASKYNTFSIGVDHHEFHAQVITDKKAKKIAKSHERDLRNVYDDEREKILEEMNHDSRRGTSLEAEHGLISHISHKKTRRHSLRYQLLFHDAHERLNSFNPLSEKLEFYHIYKGDAYKIEHKFIGKYGTMFEFDLIGLEPNTVYVGLSISYDGGVTVLPSMSVYGITRDQEKHLNSKDEAILGKPIKGAKKVPMWTKQEGIDYIGKTIVDATCDVMVKKHYEADNKGVILPLEEAHEHYDKYVDKWFAKAEKAAAEREVEPEMNFPTEEFSFSKAELAKITGTKTIDPHDLPKTKKGHGKATKIEEVEENEVEAIPLEKMTKDQLMELALKDHDEENLKGLTKPKLIELLQDKK